MHQYNVGDPFTGNLEQNKDITVIIVPLYNRSKKKKQNGRFPVNTYSCRKYQNTKNTTILRSIMTKISKKKNYFQKSLEARYLCGIMNYNGIYGQKYGRKQGNITRWMGCLALAMVVN